MRLGHVDFVSSLSSSPPSPSPFYSVEVGLDSMGRKPAAAVAANGHKKEPQSVATAAKVEKKTGKKDAKEDPAPEKVTKTTEDQKAKRKEKAAKEENGGKSHQGLDVIFRSGMGRFLSEVVDQPHLFLLVDQHPQLSTLARSVTKNLHDISTARHPATLKGRLSFGPLQELLVDGFDTEQVWEEIQMRNGPFLRSVAGLLKDPKVSPSLLLFIVTCFQPSPFQSRPLWRKKRPLSPTGRAPKAPRPPFTLTKVAKMSPPGEFLFPAVSSNRIDLTFLLFPSDDDEEDDEGEEMDFSNPEDDDDDDNDDEAGDSEMGGEDDEFWEDTDKPKTKSGKGKKKHPTEDGFFSLAEMESFVKSAEDAANRDGGGNEDDDDEEEIDFFHGIF